MKAEGLEPAAWVTEMIASEVKVFTLLKKELPISTIFQLNHKLKFRVKMFII
jgi:hypothetical protein